MLGIDPTKADDDFKITHFWMENGVPMFEFSHSADGAGKSFVSRLKAKWVLKCLTACVQSRSSGNRLCATGVLVESQFLWEHSTTFQGSCGSRLPLHAEP